MCLYAHIYPAGSKRSRSISAPERRETESGPDSPLSAIKEETINFVSSYPSTDPNTLNLTRKMRKDQTSRYLSSRRDKITSTSWFFEMKANQKAVVHNPLLFKKLTISIYLPVITKQLIPVFAYSN